MSVPFACDMTAIPAREREAHRALTRRLMTAALVELRGLPEGLGFRFPAEEYETVVAFVQWERLCCPFLSFTLEVAPEQGPIWLRLTGPLGVKPFNRAELRLGAR
jgi:hypothetical protein